MSVVANTRQPFPVSLEPVADGLTQRGGARCFLTVLAPVPSVLGVAVQRRQHLLVAVGEAHALNGQVLAVLCCQAVGHPQSQRQRPVAGNGGHAQLAACGFITTAQHEELAATDILPVPEPFSMADVAVLLQVALLPPEPPGPKAQPDPAGFNVCFQCRQPAVEIVEAAPFLVDLIPSPMLGSIGDLPLGPSDASPQAVDLQLLLLLDRRHLSLQRHPHTVEHPRRYPVPLQVCALQRRRRPACRHLSKQLALHPAAELSISTQRRVAQRPIHVPVIADAGLISGSRWFCCGAQRGRPSVVAFAVCHGYSITEQEVAISVAEGPASMDGKDHSSGPSTTITYHNPPDREQLATPPRGWFPAMKAGLGFLAGSCPL